MRNNTNGPDLFFQQHHRDRIRFSFWVLGQKKGKTCIKIYGKNCIWWGKKINEKVKYIKVLGKKKCFVKNFNGCFTNACL